TGVPPDHILIAATHTHSAPVTVSFLPWEHDAVVPRPDPDYLTRLRNGIVAAATEACGRACPAELAVTSAWSEGVGCNRLDPEGPRDPEVGVVLVRRCSDRQPFGLLMVYSMHPTVLHEDSRLVSADFPGFTRQTIELRYPGLLTLYHNGPSGNLSPRYHVRGQTFAEARRLGTLLGNQVLGALGRLPEEAFVPSPAIAAEVSRISLPQRLFCAPEEAESALRKARDEYDHLRRAGAPHGPLRTAECTVFGAEELVTLARAQAAGRTAAVLAEYTPVEVQALRLGDTCLAALPGECFVEYALEVKRRAPRTFVIGLANGELQGYVPTPEATGYEARLSFFRPEAGRCLVDAALRLVADLRRESCTAGSTRPDRRAGPVPAEAGGTAAY
ncbi:MAG: hypothetical protein JXR77_04330, partial [Lentisphaeria bacterium]|nr:hypothetical protein [Lentisphaeria bacterium]